MAALPRLTKAPLNSLCVASTSRVVLSAPSTLRPLPATRPYATTPSSADTKLSQAEALKARQQLQIKLSDKAARMKQNVGVMGNIPPFANYVRPPEFSKRSPPGASFGTQWKYIKADTRSALYDLWLRYGLRKELGKDWHDKFLNRATEAYVEVNKAIASGKYDTLSPFALNSLIDSLKAQRAATFQGFTLDHKVHNWVAKEIACVRQQELSKKGEIVAQVTVRFVTDQSLEVRNARGELVGSGRHSEPKRVTEYYLFQRELWKRRDDWKIMKKMQEVDPFNPGREEVQLV